MQKEKLYFTRLHDQWRGKEIAVKEEVRGESYSLYIQTPDIDITKGSVSSINATFKDKNKITYEVGCEIYDDTKRIFKLNMPLFVLTNEGKYEVVFTISYNSSGSVSRVEKTAIQTFTILNTIEINDDDIVEDDRYSILTQLIEELAQYKIDTSSFVNKEDVQEMIDKSTAGFSIDAIKNQLDGVYVTSKQLNDSLKNYVSNFDSAKFAEKSELNYYVKNIELNPILEKYVLKESVKTLTSNDLTDELYRKLVNLPNEMTFDDTTLKELINKKADIDWVNERIKEVNSGIDSENYYDIIAINEMLESINETHSEDINNLSEDINNLSEDINTQYLKKEDYEYLDGINAEDVKINDSQTLYDVINDILYKEIEIKKFHTTYTTNIREIGTKIDYVELQWELNKTPVSQSLTEYYGSINNSTRNAYINKSYNKTQDFVLTVSDEKVTKNETITIYFVNPYFYGSYKEDELTANIIKIGSKIIDIKNTQTIRLEYQDSKIFFAYPSDYGYLIDIKDGNGLSYNDDFTMSVLTIDNFVYNVYTLEDKTTVPQITFSFIFGKEEE